MNLDTHILKRIIHTIGLTVLAVFCSMTSNRVFAADVSLSSDFAADDLTVAVGDTFTTNGYNLDIGSGGLSLAGTLDAASGAGGTSQINVAGNWTNTGTFTADDSTVILDAASGTVTVTTNGSAFNGLTLNDGGGGVTFTLADALVVNGDLTITGGELDTAGFAVDVGGNVNNDDTLTANDSRITVAGSWDNAAGATFDAGTGYVNFASGDADETVTTNGDGFNNVTFWGPTDGLVGHWTFNNADIDWADTGAEIKDISGNGNDGNASTSGMNASNVVTGARGQGLEFDGSSEYVRVSYDSVLSIGSQSWSISAWIKTISVSSSIVNRYECGWNSCGSVDGNASALYGLSINSSGQLSADLRDDSNNTCKTVGGSNLADNQWHHVVFVLNRSDDTLKVYVDLVEEGSESSASVGAINDGDTPLFFGVNWRDGWATPILYLDGFIDDVRIYNRALSAAEVAALYESGKYTLQDTLDVNGDMTLASGELAAGANDITVAGDWANVGGAFDAGTAEVTFNGTGAQSLKSGAESFNDLAVNGTGNTVTQADDLDVNGSLTITSGTLDASTSNYNITLAGNWTNTDTFTARAGTVIFDKPNGTQSLTGNTTFYNLTKTDPANDSTDVTLQVDDATTVTIAAGGTLTLTGIDDDDRVNLISDNPGSKFTFYINDDQTVNWVDVTDSEVSAAAAGTDIRAVHGKESNTDREEASPHWIFSGGGDLIFFF